MNRETGITRLRVPGEQILHPAQREAAAHALVFLSRRFNPDHMRHRRLQIHHNRRIQQRLRRL